MDSLIEFLNARLDEDEAIAIAALQKLFILPDDVLGTQEHINHIARHDPARVLREVAAKRKVLNDYRMTRSAIRHVAQDNVHAPGLKSLYAALDSLSSVVRILASIYSDHPDYREEWA